MSVSSAVARGSSFSFAADATHLLASDGGQLPVKQRGKLFFLECQFKRNPMTLVTKTRRDNRDAMLWHRGLRYLNQHDLSSLVNVGELEFCEVCTASKMHEVAVPKKTESRASAVRQRVFLSFIDDFSRLVVVKYLVKKSDALLKFQEFVAEHGTPKCLRTDNGGEYSSNIFRRFCREFQVKREFTVPNTPQQNGVAERYNRVITEVCWPKQTTEDVLGASNVDSREGLQLVSHIQQRQAHFTDVDVLWKTIKSELFACVRLPGLLSGSRQQTETGSKAQEKQVHRLRRGEQSLPAAGSRDKKSGASKKRDIQ